MTSLYIFFSTSCLILQLSSKASIIILWHVSNFFHLTFWQLTFMAFNDSAWILYRNNFLWCWNATLSVYIDLMKRLLSLDQVFKDLEIFLCLFASSKKYYSIHCNRHWHGKENNISFYKYLINNHFWHFPLNSSTIAAIKHLRII